MLVQAQITFGLLLIRRMAGNSRCLFSPMTKLLSSSKKGVCSQLSRASNSIFQIVDLSDVMKSALSEFFTLLDVRTKRVGNVVMAYTNIVAKQDITHQTTVGKLNAVVPLMPATITPLNAASASPYLRIGSEGDIYSVGAITKGASLYLVGLWATSR